MIQNLAYFMIADKPLMAYFGGLTLFFLLFTASIAVLNKKGIRTIPFKWHPRLAGLTIILAVFHAILVLSLYYKF